MLKRTPFIIVLVLSLCSLGFAQEANSNSNTTQTRKRTTTTTTRANGNTNTTNNANRDAQTPAAKPEKTSAKDPSARGVLAAFESLLEGIRHTDVEAVTTAYWNSPQLILFNNNGTVTRGWQQLHENRANSYPNLKDVKLDVRDLRVQMLGQGGALVTCLWTQSQTYKGTPETASGRMTIVFRRVGNSWKAIHLHTSPDAPEPNRLPASERPAPTPAQRPGATP
jgi:ketosteroid isomerase-like protein